MTLPSGYMTNEDFQFHVATVETPGAGDWDDISNEIVSAGPGTAGGRTRVETNVFANEAPIVTVGRRAATDMPLTIVYLEDSGSLWSKLQSAYENKTKVWFKFAPKGATAGNQSFSGYCDVLSPLIPGGAASDAGVVQVSTTLTTSSFDPDAITS